MRALTRMQYKAFLRERLDPGRMRHSLLVEKTAFRLAALHGLDWYRAGMAGLLHDICRCDNQKWQLDYMQKNGVRLDEAWLQNPQIWHALCGSVFLEKELGLRDRSILLAVRYHTSCRPGMTALEKVVCLADAISEDRVYSGVDILRQAASRSLDEAMYIYLSGCVERAAKKGLPLVRETLEAYNEYTCLQYHGTGKDVTK